MPFLVATRHRLMRRRQEEEETEFCGERYGGCPGVWRDRGRRHLFTRRRTDVRDGTRFVARPPSRRIVNNISLSLSVVSACVDFFVFFSFRRVSRRTDYYYYYYIFIDIRRILLEYLRISSEGFRNVVCNSR